MKRFFKIVGGILLLAVLIYLLGPKASFASVNNDPYHKTFNLDQVENYIQTKESKISNIKPDNQSQFVWQDSLNKTDYSVVYLHGFSASHGEAFPILDNFSKRYKCNMYKPRLYLHGLNDVDAFVNITPEKWLKSAKEAISIGKAIGHKLIVISTSTGSTLAAYLAANDPDIHALIMTSPNFDLYDQNSYLLTKPWGKQIFKQIMGGNYREWNANESIKKYWTTKNRIEAHIAMRDLLNQTMTNEVFKKITQPVFIGYYYRDEDNCDKIISIDAIDEFGKTISTPKDKVSILPFANARGHVISSIYMNKAWEDVQNAIFDFCDNKVFN